MKKYGLHLQLCVTSLITLFALQTIPLGISNTLVYYFSPDLAGSTLEWRLVLIFLFTYGGIILMVVDYIAYIRPCRLGDVENKIANERFRRHKEKDCRYVQRQ